MKRFLFFSLFLSLFLTAFCLCASAEIFTGRALDVNYIMGGGEEEGDELSEEAYDLAGYYKVQFELNTETGVLRIFCDPSKNPQKMLPYAQGEWVPWTKDSMRPYIKTAIIEEGILSVGRFSFLGCENLETVYVPHSVLRIDQTSFYQCPRLKEIYYAGNESDFNRYVEYQDVRNEYTDANGNTLKKARDLFVFGESVTVFCRNQDGEYFDSYTVGGFAVGDSYSITPRVYESEALTFVGKKALYEGTFKKNDKTQLVFDYTCAHEYQFKDETLHCSSVCIHCTCADPAETGEKSCENTVPLIHF